jgi:hypothetical protein
MWIHGLGTYGYRGQLDEEWNEYFAAPSWDQIEAAIRRLNANEYAGVRIGIAGMYHDGGGQPSLHITGGNNKFLVTYDGGGGSGVHYIDVAKSDEQGEVGIVTRDQGVWVPPSSVCSDLELLITIARYFTETGRPYPNVQWG